MCGILGFIGQKNTSLSHRMVQSIIHRGRDETIIKYISGVNIGMTRLAINDIKNGLYPMAYRQFRLVYNGEIYNYRELVSSLAGFGVVFKTRCDGEVILPLYARYGPRAFAMLDGMFAICIIDKENRRMVLARDKTGEKPLYYGLLGKHAIFASEMKALFSFDTLPKNINCKALAAYLHDGHVSGRQTLVSDIRKLEPATFIDINLTDGSTRIASYWSPTPIQSVRRALDNNPIDKLETMIRASVQERLLSDVPVGCFLSGGVDSSLVTAIASQHIRKMHTFSVGFGTDAAYDESRFSQTVAQQLGTDHTEIICTPSRVRSIIKNIGTLIDEPIIDAAVLPTFLLAQEARKKVKVVLTGEGADELFGGYGRYQNELLASVIRKIISRIPYTTVLMNRLLPGKYKKLTTPLSQHYYGQTVWSTGEIAKLLRRDVVSPDISSTLIEYEANNPLLAMQLADLNGFLASQLLMKVDKMTMANNLESRAPYLDSAIVEFALSLKMQDKIRGVHGKYLLKKVAERYFPRSFVWRTKKGFFVPLDEWFRHELRDVVYDSIDTCTAWQHLIDQSYYRRVVSDHMNETQNNADKIWGIIVLLSWLKQNKINV